MTHGKHIQMTIYDELAAELRVDPQAHPQHSSTNFNLHSNISHLLFYLNSGKKCFTTLTEDELNLLWCASSITKAVYWNLH